MRKNSAKVKVTRKREILTYSELWHASQCVLSAGQQNPKGCSWQFLSSVMLTAFALEAYLNHVGPRVLQCWDGLEKLSPLGKLDLLCEILGVVFPKDKRPRNTLNELIKFRNSLAHGQTETISPKATLHDANDDVQTFFESRLLTKWEDKIQNPIFALRVREDVKEVLEKVHAKIPNPKEFLFTFGLTEGGASLIHD